MKRLFSSTSLLSVAIALTPTALLFRPATANTFLSGDVDGNGQVNGADLELLSDYLAGATTLVDDQIAAADVDQDGVITQADYSQLSSSIQAASPRINSEVQLDSAYSGQVIDRATGEPLANVAVDIPGAGVAVRTDSQGRFTLPENVPSDEILTAKLEDYTPFSQTTSGDGEPLRVELDRLNENTTHVLQTDVVHLGDDQYSEQSAGAQDFRLRAQGREMVRQFRLERVPSQPAELVIGSLIGLDTAAAVRAGQSGIATADMSPMEIELNGQTIHTIDIAADNIRIPLSPSYLRPGQNTVVIRTGKVSQVVSTRRRGPSIAIPIFGGNIRARVPAGQRLNGIPLTDHDDVELANVRVEVP
ncbi:MAG: dockerin type I domain-containing protein [Cyanobacteria bacterium P01_A01_bin.3]